jgi:hypothetical protein
MKSLLLGVFAIASFAAHSFGQTIIKNGIIVGFTRGVFFNYPGGSTSNSGNIVQNLRLTNNGVRVTLFNAKGSIVRNNQITGPGSNVASTGIDIEGGGGNLVSGNVISAFRRLRVC